MPVSRAAAAASGVILALSAATAGAQTDWNDARTLELVGAATARRAVQLADTGLRDYTARATGTLTFLAQFGDGVLSRPVVVKSDQLALEVYWGAPDRSKQRIVGRRDTLLLPTDINYHRDHLGIIQNNFPDVIRLGDGDEVLDVPHPLSAAGQAIYDYRIADSLVIRGQGLALDVMMVSVRPKDARVPAAVGAVYLDRGTASVVRMTFSFTRAALRDRQLEDVSVILENGLVEGRYWLPRRQEIEIRRSASWMDFPAKGIIRGRWEICCIEANIGVPGPVFYGAEVVEAGTAAQLRAFPFEGEVIDALPEDVRALDAPEVRAVQEEARRLVQAAALARTRSSNLSARGISDFVRSDRAEGLAIGAGLSQRLGAGFAASIRGRYGSADERFKVRGEFSWRNAAGLKATLTGADDWRQLGEVQETSGIRNSIAAQEFGSDWTQPIGVQGGALRVERATPRFGTPSLEIGHWRERWLAERATPAFGRFEPTVLANRIDRREVALGWAHAGAGPDGSLEWRLRSRVAHSSARSVTSSGPGNNHLRFGLDAEVAVDFPSGRVRARTISAATREDPFGVVLEQDYVRFGGPESGPGYDFHSLVAIAGVSQRLEWQRRVPFVPISLGRFGRAPSSLVLAPYAHGVWLHRPYVIPGVGDFVPPRALGGNGWNPSLGLGVIGFFDLLRIDVARGLRDGRWAFSVDVARSLWPVL